MHRCLYLGSITEGWNDTIEECPGGFNPGKNPLQAWTNNMTIVR